MHAVSSIVGSLADYLLALDIGGTKLAVGAARRGEFSRTGKLRHILKEPVPIPGSPDVVIPRVLAMVRSMIGDAVPAAVGISIGGPLDHATGTVVNFPHLPGWRNIPLCDEVGRALGAPCRLDNDANLGALAEHRWGAGRDVDDMVYLTISTGIGGGVIVGGRLLHGAGSAAGEVGHITVLSDGPRCACGNHGCLEAVASGTSIARRAREAVAGDHERGRSLLLLAGGEPGAITPAMVFGAARDGDALARELVAETAEYLAVGLAAVIHTLAPSVIVLGGGVAQVGDDLLIPLRERLRSHVFYVPLDLIRITGASLGHDSAIIGAATLALDLAGEAPPPVAAA